MYGSRGTEGFVIGGDKRTSGYGEFLWGEVWN